MMVKYREHIITTASSIIVLLAFALSSCAPNKPEEIKALTDRENLPGLTVKDLTTIITDSGRIKYRFITPKLLQFDQRSEPTIEFPLGLHLFIFDNNEQVEAQIKCKHAIFFQNKELWELRNDVEAVNINGDVINTEMLNWDQRKNMIYSNQFIKITTRNQIITGYGFESDERLENYKIKNISGILEIEEPVEPGYEN